MARETYLVAPIKEATVEAINRLIADLNAVFERITNNLDSTSARTDLDLQGHRIRNLGQALLASDAARFDQLPTLAQAAALEDATFLDAQAAPPEVEDAGAIGASNGRAAREQHTHAGVNLSDAQTVGGAKRFSGNVGFNNTAPAAQSTGWSVANPVSNKALDVTASTLTQTKEILGTLIAYLLLRGDVGA